MAVNPFQSMIDFVEKQMKRGRAYKLLLAYAECAATQRADGLYDATVLTKYGWNSNSTWEFMKDLNLRALEAAKEVG